MFPQFLFIVILMTRTSVHVSFHLHLKFYPKVIIKNQKPKEKKRLRKYSLWRKG